MELIKLIFLRCGEANFRCEQTVFIGIYFRPLLRAPRAANDSIPKVHMSPEISKYIH